MASILKYVPHITYTQCYLAKQVIYSFINEKPTIAIPKLIREHTLFTAQYKESRVLHFITRVRLEALYQTTLLETKQLFLKCSVRYHILHKLRIFIYISPLK